MVTYQDEIVIFRVVTGAGKQARKILLRLKEKLKEEFQQEEILVITRNVGI